jgi:transcription antitermination factor NusG
LYRTLSEEILFFGKWRETVGHEEWFALQVRTGAERQVATTLRAKGYEEFLPLWTVTRKSVSSLMPLFPGYLFCQINPHAQGLIVTTPGVIRILAFGGRPAPIDPEEIRSIQIIVNSGVPLCTWWGLQLGDKVYVQDGPLRGAVGIVTSIRAKQRLVVSIPMMMRTIAAEIDPEWVTALGPLPAHKPPVSGGYGNPLGKSSAATARTTPALGMLPVLPDQQQNLWGSEGVERRMSQA